MQRIRIEAGDASPVLMYCRGFVCGLACARDVV